MGTIRVVIADDHAVVREGTRRILEHEPDIEVVGEASNGAETVTLVESLRPDVAIVDIAMPGMDGLEATKRIKISRPGTSVLVLTAYDDDPFVFALLAAGAAGYLLKDIPASDLVQAIRRVFAGEPVLHPAIARKVIERLTAEAPETTHTPKRDVVALTDRENEVLRLAAAGMTNAQIAVSLQLSPRTVQAYLAQIFGKLGVASRTEAVITGLRVGILKLDDLDER
jgi:DNA-binding NarL/FixJ family response regulator